MQVVLEADAPRVDCPAHGPTVVAVPWARRHHAGHTYAFDDTVAWLAVACSKTAVCELMRIAWRTVGAIVARVWSDTEKKIDRFANLRRIGIDEISYKRHHRYLTVVVDHDSGRLVWAAPGRDTATLGRFFDALGAERCALITHVSADAADWIADVVTQRCPAAIRCADPFHVVAWATEALDAERRRAWNDARALARREPSGVASSRARTLRRVQRMSTPASSRAPGMRCGKTPKTSPNARPPNWPGSPKPTPACIGPICSKRACGMCFRSKARKASRPWSGGSVLGAALPHPGIRGAGRPHRATPTSHRRRPRSRPVPRADRIHQHQDPTPDPDRVRIPLPRSPNRPGHARTRRPPPRTTRPNKTPTDQSVEPHFFIIHYRRL